MQTRTGFARIRSSGATHVALSGPSGNRPRRWPGIDVEARSMILLPDSA